MKAYHGIMLGKWVSFALSLSLSLSLARKYQQGEEMQMNMVQNPFPDLFHSECLLPWTKNSATQVKGEKPQKLLLVLNSLSAPVHMVYTWTTPFIAAVVKYWF